MKFLRNFIGGFLVFLDRVIAPKVVSRSQEDQTKVDSLTRNLSLYQFERCPFCIKVRREMRRLKLNIQLRDIARSPQDESDLVKFGGQKQVPCLRIQKSDGSFQWMYESADIIKYLDERFTP